MGQLFNIYCDESRVENVDSTFMIIGSVTIPRSQKKKIANDLLNILTSHSFTFELKWTKLHQRYENMYKALIDYFYANADINFRCIVVDKSAIDYGTYHENDKELAFFKFYYLLLRIKLLNNTKYYIFIDKKPTRDKNRARALHSFLDSYTLYYKNNCTIKHLQAYNSKENILLQFTDFFTGLVGFAVNQENTDGIKWDITHYLQNKLSIKTFLKSSYLSENKFNLFIWKGASK